MTPDAMAALHSRCFGTSPRPWSAEEFIALLAEASTHAEVTLHGFALTRVAGPEAELLTIAVSPEARRQGVGAQLLAAIETAARARRAEEMFLEVAADNAAARALYASAGYGQVGRRPRYYAGTDALVLRKPLT